MRDISNMQNGLKEVIKIDLKKYKQLIFKSIIRKPYKLLSITGKRN